MLSSLLLDRVWQSKPCFDFFRILFLPIRWFKFTPNLYQKGCFANDKLVKISVNWKINFEPQSCKDVSIATLTASLQMAVVTFDIDAIFAAVLFRLNQCLVFQLNDGELSSHMLNCQT